MVLVVPLLLLGSWGGRYLLDCLSLLSAPGVPVKLTLHTHGGVLVARADSYAIDVRRGWARLTRPKIYDPSGAALASIDYVEVTGLDALAGSHQIVRVHGSNLAARIVRLPSGRLQIQDYLPPRTNEPGRIPYQVRIDGVRARLVDLLHGQKWEQAATAPRLWVAGLGDDWVATGQATLPGIGRVDAQVQGVASRGVQIAAQTAGVRLETVYRHFVAVQLPDNPDLAKLKFGTLTAFGPVRVFVPTGRGPNLETKLQATATDVRYGDLTARRGWFRGLVTSQGAAGAVRLEGERLSLRFEGSGRFLAPRSAAGAVDLSAPDPSALPKAIAALLPPDVDFRNAAFDGWLSYRQGGRSLDLQASGIAKAASASYRNQTLQNVDVAVNGDPSRLLVNLRGARYRSRPVTAVATLDLRHRTVVGAGSAAGIDLGQLAQAFGLGGVGGLGGVEATVAGSFSHPTVSLTASGNAEYRVPNGPKLNLGNFQVAGTYADGALQLRRGLLRSGLGLITATGLAAPNRMDVRVVGRGIDLAGLDPHVGGRANLEARLTGTFQQPALSGLAEVYSLEAGGKTIPVVSSDFRVDRRMASLTNLHVLRGTGTATGRATYVFADRGVDATLTATRVQLADFLGQEFVGSVDVPELKVSGTLRHPVVAGRVTGTDLVVRGVEVKNLEVDAAASGTVVTLTQATAEAANGKVGVTGHLDASTGDGELTATATDLALDRLAPEIAEDVTLEGTGSGKATARLRHGGLAGVTGSGTIANVVVNGTEVGSGNWAASLAGDDVTGRLAVGQLDRYLDLSDLRLNLRDRTLAGRLDANRLKIEDLVQMGKRYMAGLTPTETQAVDAVHGLVSVGATFGGSLAEPNVDVSTLQATDLTYHDRPMGTLSARFDKQDRLWTVQQLALAGPLANAHVTGTAAENGPINLDGEVTGLNLQQLGLIAPGLAGQTGTADVSFVARGQTSRPEITASLDARGLLARAGQPAERSLRVSLNQISVAESQGNAGGIDVSGEYYYRGFTGDISAHTPFRYPFSIPDDQPSRATVTLAPHSLQEVASLVDGLDPKRTQGSVSGQVAAEGPINDLTFDGLIHLTADTLAASGVDTTAKNLAATLSMDKGQIRLQGSATSSRGGAVTVDANTPILDLRHLADTLEGGGLTTILGDSVAGTATFADLRVRQDFPGRTYADGRVNGTVNLGGTVGSPLLSGNLQVLGVDSVLPSLETQTREVSNPVVNPRFDLRVALGTPAHLRSSTADLYLVGGGNVSGSLAAPAVDADLSVDHGSIRLPASLVRLDPGGSLALRYNGNPANSQSSLDVDLQGRTSVTTQGATPTSVDRYDITLNVRGDLLKDSGLNLTASSDPPGLSQDQILSLLGETDVIASLGTSGRRDAQTQIRNALAGYALPVLFDPLTSPLARTLGLDYLSVEYNAFDGASVVFARPFGKGFSLQGSRQVSEPQPGFPVRYDLRLVYHPRRFRGILSNFDFSVGMDQDRPWKIAVEYGVRF